MRIRYDPEVDVLSIVFNDVPVEESDEEKPGLILDYDKSGNIVGVEILDASKRMENPRSLDYAFIKDDVESILAGFEETGPCERGSQRDLERDLGTSRKARQRIQLESARRLRERLAKKGVISDSVSTLERLRGGTLESSE